jgi:KDO2-lipid IV(A) lauroyltransferase
LKKPHPFEQRIHGTALRLVMRLFGALPLDRASAVGGWLTRQIGPWLPVHRIAERNLRRALPELGEADVRRTLAAMWDNLGRITGEYPHLAALAADEERVQIVDHSGVRAALDKGKAGGILISAHYGNWELCPVPALRIGLPLSVFHRALNNPFSDAVIQELRRPLVTGRFLPKGRKGALAAMSLLKGRQFVGLLVDQKQNDGIPVEFFGREAMTTPAPAVFHQHFRAPVAAARVERLKGARFRIIVQSVPMVDTGDRVADVATNTRRINALFEDWIRARPDLWFWPHRRWPD